MVILGSGVLEYTERSEGIGRCLAIEAFHLVTGGGAVHPSEHPPGLAAAG